MGTRADIAARLKYARKSLGISQQKVAVVLGLSRSAVSLIENGQRGIDSLELSALAKLYQRPIGSFTGEEPTPLRSDIALLAKHAAKLSDQDRNELLRFTEFLVQRSQIREPDETLA